MSTLAFSADSPLLHPHVWRASHLGVCSQPCVASGFERLDAELPGGGWPTRGLSEILSPQFGTLEWRLLAPGLRSLWADAAAAAAPATAAGRRKRPAPNRREPRPLLLINPPHTPHLPGLRACGLPPQQIVWIAPETAPQQLWATEQAIKSNAAAAIVAWLPQARAEQVRRLQACALGAQAPVFLLRPWAAQAQSSAAPLRLLLRPGAGWSLEVRLLKRRGPAQEGWLSLPSIPAELAALLTPRMRALPPPEAGGRPGSAGAPSLEPSHALARPAAVPAARQR